LKIGKLAYEPAESSRARPESTPLLVITGAVFERAAF
jgi:hypothetical protein